MAALWLPSPARGTHANCWGRNPTARATKCSPAGPQIAAAASVGTTPSSVLCIRWDGPALAGEHTTSRGPSAPPCRLDSRKTPAARWEHASLRGGSAGWAVCHRYLSGPCMGVLEGAAQSFAEHRAPHSRLAWRQSRHKLKRQAKGRHAASVRERWDRTPGRAP